MREEARKIERGSMESGSGGLKLARLSLRKNESEATERAKEPVDLGLEPMTPVGRLFSQPKMNCYIITIIRIEKPVDTDALKAGLGKTLAMHKRFCSRVEKDSKGSLFWSPVKVNMDDHFFVVEEDPSMPISAEDYAETLAEFAPMDQKLPLWQVHLLAESGSAIFKIHHSLGDGVSLMSLLLACTNLAGDRNSLPEIPRQTRSTRLGISRNGAFFRVILQQLWTFVLLLWYTLLDVTEMLATFVWLKDSQTLIKGSAGVERSPFQIVHRSFSLADVKAVKGAIQGTINDVLIAVTSAGLRCYLERKYKAEHSRDSRGSFRANLPKKLRVRSTTLVNIRPTPGLQDVSKMMEFGLESKERWGNSLGYIILPMQTAKCENPLDYARNAKAISTKKKLSLAAYCSHWSAELIMKVAGVEVKIRCM
eukprot:TRINITY_DN3666_c0_g1_i6.p1 TRINITY_DN3666_c0_g1~~TRINITY_DN3666_c0_g1_i6.p1  ORF type:complete len:423 (+),score=21.79 TRINITY_DN3666_c0_g1_i6:456-1724(+)